MKKLIAIVLAVSLVLTLVLGSGLALAGKGNDLPSGPHYNLNIIGAPKDKNPDAEGWTNPNRHTIMVSLDKKTNIYMTQAQDGGFSVIDADGTDGVARFELAPGRYEVFAVALGKPNKSVTITPEATFEGQIGDEVFYLGSITLEHKKKPKWERVTGLFLVTVTVEVDSVTTTYHNAWVFSIDELIEYWWDYDNNGCKLTQVRFYQVESIPEEGT